MPQIVLFNHIPKTAGSTVRYILWRQVGRARVLTSTTGKHEERIASIARQLEGPLDGDFVVQTHAGCGFEKQLPAWHTYRAFTYLRDPIDRTISRYFYGRDRPPDSPGGIPDGMSLAEFLAEETLLSFNAQTAFMGGLWAEHHFEGGPVDRGAFGGALLERAKRNLEAQDVVGLMERFDESLLLLRDAFGWPMHRTLYRRANLGKARRAALPLSDADHDAIRANNELDTELYEFGCELFARRLEELPDRQRRLERFKRLNDAYGRFYTSVFGPGRALVRSLWQRK